MTNFPLVSIAMCTYNGERFLKEQLDSLVYQDYPNLEIVITDDCSKDQTPQLLQEYSNRFPFIRLYFNKRNLGYIKNFENSIQLCNGDLIALSDQDDIWSTDKISKMVNHIGAHMLLYHDSEFIDDTGESLNKKMSDILNMYAGDSFKPFLFFNSVSGHACLFKKELIKISLPFPEEIYHDRWLTYTAVNLGTIGYLNLPLVRYRQHRNADTNILRLNRTDDSSALEGKQKIIKTISELEVLLKFKFNKERAFLEKLLYLYRDRLNAYLCPELFVFMYKNYETLLYMSTKNTMSKLNFVFKHIWGGKLKKLD